ncbi:unnamed protein product [Tilletia caries]|nr:unnamed protein product [Tilletia caries]
MEPMGRASLRTWKLLHAPRLVQTTLILARIAAGAFGIEELNLRLSLQQDLLNIVHELVARNTRLRIVRIEVDSAVVNNRNIRPTIRLDEMFNTYQTRTPLQRLVIRAPGCDIKIWSTSRQLQQRFFTYLGELKEVVLACYAFNALLPTLLWIYHLLRHMPKLESADFAVYMPDCHKSSLWPSIDLPMLQMHVLTKLSLQIPEVDTHFLRKVNALGLYKLRISSSMPVSNWPLCVDDHFPNLFIVNVLCPGPSASRLRALGVSHKWYYHNLGGIHNSVHDHQCQFLAYIKPYSRRRFGFIPPALGTAKPYRLPEACELGLDEEFSDATDSSGSDLSESEDELLDQQEDDAPSVHDDTDQVPLLHDDIDLPSTAMDSNLGSDLEDSSSVVSDLISMTHHDIDADLEHTSATGTELPDRVGPDRATPPPHTSSSAYVASSNASSSSSAASSSATPTFDLPRPLKRSRLS